MGRALDHLMAMQRLIHVECKRGELLVRVDFFLELLVVILLFIIHCLELLVAYLGVLLVLRHPFDVIGQGLVLFFQELIDIQVFELAHPILQLHCCDLQFVLQCLSFHDFGALFINLKVEFLYVFVLVLDLLVKHDAIYLSHSLFGNR